MIAGGINTPTFSPITIGTNNFDAMTTWKSQILDFSDFVCSSPTITITFFSRSDIASNLGFQHSYAYFAAQCLPGNVHHTDLNLPNKDIACANNVQTSCTTISLPLPYSFTNYELGNYYYNDLLSVSVEESNNGIVFTPTTVAMPNHWDPTSACYIPDLTLCKAPDSNPYKYFRITYKNFAKR